MKKTIELKDFLDFKYISNINYAPDEKHIACIMSTAQEEDNRYHRNLYVYDGSHMRQLTSNNKESMFLWEDNEHILFTNMRDKNDMDVLEKGEERTCFYRINIHGGEALKAFQIPLSVTSIKQVSETLYVFSADYHLQYSRMYGLDEKQKENLLKEKNDMKDYEIFDEVPFYGNGQGIINKERSTLFTFNTLTQEITRISEEYFSVSDYELSEDHTQVFYAGQSYQTNLKNKEGINVYDIHNRSTTELLDQGMYGLRKILPWENELLVVASDGKRYGLNENGNFYLYNKETKNLDMFKGYDDSIGSSVGSDCRYGGGRAIKVYKDSVYFITTVFNRSVLYKLTINKEIKTVYDCEGSVDEFDIANDEIAFIGMQDMRLQELYTCDINGKQRKQITTYNEAFYNEKDIRPCIPCNIKQGDMTLYGWVLEPKDYDPNKSYPAILDVHGGPKTVYGEVYYHEMQVWANKGYFVFFMNPRGGDGRGNSFMDIRGKYGTIDYDDLMKFTDQVCTMYPSIDVHRIGVTGGSYGGFMTNWIIGHTQRFKVAASQRSISNWISFANTSDIGNFFTTDQQAGNIYDDVEALWEHSPLKHARNVKTPTLFIHSDEDYRCPLSEGMQMYSALVNLGVEARMCVFHGENHELSRSGKPKHRVKRLEEITNWMDHYLK